MSPHPASSAILVRNGRLLLVKRSNPPAANMYAFPGGRGEIGESPDQTAIREFYEETGIVVRDPVAFMTFDLDNRPHGGHFELTVFIVESDDPSEGLAGDDAAALGWFTPDETARLPAPESVHICIRRLVADRRI